MYETLSYNNYYWGILWDYFSFPPKMKSTLKVHNPRVIRVLICINDVQGKELNF